MKKIALLLFSLNAFAAFSQTFQWSNEINNAVNNYLGGVSCDTLNNVYVSGQFGPGVHWSPSNKYGFFRSKYNASGLLLWSDTTVISSVYSSTYTSSLCGEKNGNTFLSGTCLKTFKVGDSTIHFPFSSSHSFLLKQDKDGHILWTQALPRITTTCTVLSNGFLYISGKADAPEVIDGVNIPAGGFVAKFNTGGTCLKAIHTGSTKVQMSAADNAGNLYVILGDLSDPKYVVKYDDNDSLLWSKSLGSVTMYGLIADAGENVYITYGGMAGVVTYKLDANGDVLWNKAYYSYYPQSVYHTAGSSVYYSITTRNDSIKASYVGTYDDADGTLLSYEPISLPPGYYLYLKTRIISNFSGNLVVGGNYQSDYQRVAVKKYSLGAVAGIQEEHPSSSLSVYPNPSKGIFQVHHTVPEKSKLQLSILNAQGQQIYSESTEALNGSFDREIDLRGYAKGIYTVVITENNRRKHTEKIVIN